jgi:hypothetical protein
VAAKGLPEAGTGCENGLLTERVESKFVWLGFARDEVPAI